MASPSGILSVGMALPRRGPVAEADSVAQQFSALQSVAGNRAIAGVVGRAQTGILREAAPLAGDDAFNPSSITDDLIRAIDQSDINPSRIPASELEGEGKGAGEVDLREVPRRDVVVRRLGLPHLGPGMRWARKVDADKVIAVLDNLKPSQIDEVRKLYRQLEKRPLDEDLFEKGESGYPSGLSDDQRDRVQGAASRNPARAHAPGRGRRGRRPRGRPKGRRPLRSRRDRDPPAPGRRSGRGGAGAAHGAPAAPGRRITGATPSTRSTTTLPSASISTCG